MTATERRAHLPLHGPPHPFQARTHPRFSVPVHAPLPHIPGFGSKCRAHCIPPQAKCQSNDCRWSPTKASVALLDGSSATSGEPAAAVLT